MKNGNGNGDASKTHTAFLMDMFCFVLAHFGFWLYLGNLERIPGELN